MILILDIKNITQNYTKEDTININIQEELAVKQLVLSKNQNQIYSQQKKMKIMIV